MRINLARFMRMVWYFRVGVLDPKQDRKITIKK